jgi:hypothetical protein
MPEHAPPATLAGEILHLNQGKNGHSLLDVGTRAGATH